MSKFIISCGGTGGHLAPGIAIGQALLAKGNEVIFVISQKEIDSKLIKKYTDFKIYRTPGAPFSWNPIKLLKFVYQHTKSTFLMLYIMRKEKCDVAMTFGGFTSIGLSLSAQILRIPLILHESNRKAGKAVKVLGRFAYRVYVPFGVHINRRKAGVIKHAGYPIREEIKKIPEDEAKDFFGFDKNANVLLVLGGSQGARALNNWASVNFDKLALQNIDVLCICGPGNASYSGSEAMGSDGRMHKIKYMEFCDNMSAAMSSAKVGIARAGAGTIAEFARCKLPSILVPFPHSADDHQLENARCFEKQGSSILVEQRNLNELFDEAVNMMKNEKLRSMMLKNLERVDDLNDIDKIVSDLTLIAHGKA